LDNSSPSEKQDYGFRGVLVSLLSIVVLVLIFLPLRESGDGPVQSIAVFGVYLFVSVGFISGVVAAFSNSSVYQMFRWILALTWILSVIGIFLLSGYY